MIELKFTATTLEDIRTQMERAVLSIRSEDQVNKKISHEILHETEIVEEMYPTQAGAPLPVPTPVAETSPRFETVYPENKVSHMGAPDFLQKAAEIPQRGPTIQQVTSQPVPGSTDQPRVQVASAEPTVNTHGKRDSAGIPWDERIHSGSQAFNADGTWRARRNVKPEMVKMVENEIRGTATMNASQPSPAPQPLHVVQQPVASAQVFTPPPPQVTVPVETPVFIPPAQPVAQPVSMPASQPSYDNIVVPQVVKPAHNLETFKANLIPLFATLVQEKKIDQAYVESLKAYFQVKEIWEVASDNGKAQELFDVFAQAGFVTAV